MDILRLVAVLATFLAGTAGQMPPDVTRDLVDHCTPVVQPGTFIGCEDRTSLPDDDATYGGLVWIDGQVTPVAGP